MPSGARERFRERLAGRIVAHATDGGRSTFADHDELLTGVRKTRDYQRLATRVWPRETADGLCAIYAEHPDGGPGGLYTALTRSTRALVMVHADELPGALADARLLRRAG